MSSTAKQDADLLARPILVMDPGATGGTFPVYKCLNL